MAPKAKGKLQAKAGGGARSTGSGSRSRAGGRGRGRDSQQPVGAATAAPASPAPTLSAAPADTAAAPVLAPACPAPAQLAAAVLPPSAQTCARKKAAAEAADVTSQSQPITAWMVPQKRQRVEEEVAPVQPETASQGVVAKPDVDELKRAIELIPDITFADSPSDMPAAQPQGPSSSSSSASRVLQPTVCEEKVPETMPAQNKQPAAHDDGTRGSWSQLLGAGARSSSPPACAASSPSVVSSARQLCARLSDPKDPMSRPVPQVVLQSGATLLADAVGYFSAKLGGEIWAGMREKARRMPSTWLVGSACSGTDIWGLVVEKVMMEISEMTSSTTTSRVTFVCEKDKNKQRFPQSLLEDNEECCVVRRHHGHRFEEGLVHPTWLCGWALQDEVLPRLRLGLLVHGGQQTQPPLGGERDGGHLQRHRRVHEIETAMGCRDGKP